MENQFADQATPLPRNLPSQRTASMPPTPWGMLPPRMRMLFVSDDQGMAAWLQDSFAADLACTIEIIDAVNPVLAIEHAKEENFDAILVSNDSELTLSWIEAIRHGTNAWQPIMVVGSTASREFSALCYEAGADGFLAIDTMTIRELIWHLARASERRRLLEENQHMQYEERQRHDAEHTEIMKLVAEQRAIVGMDARESQSEEATIWLDAEISGLLTNYFVMGTQHVSDELHRFTEVVTQRGFNKNQIVSGLLRVLDQRIREVRPENAAELYLRGNILLLELTTKLEMISMKSSTEKVA